MKALITGASSGIGKEMALYLSKLGYDLVLVARRRDRLEELRKQLNTNTEIIVLDISDIDNCKKLYDIVKDIDILINNAGFGIFGEFNKVSLDKEISLINTNIIAVHVLTKLYLNDFIKKNSGYILNTASTAAFFSGPLMSSYYASKGYVLKLTEAINQELRKNKSNVYIGALCPGPVNTEFNDVANVKFGIKALKSDFVAKYAIDKMLNKKTIIIPGLNNKLLVTFGKILPRKLLLKILYKVQRKKEK